MSIVSAIVFSIVRSDVEDTGRPSVGIPLGLLLTFKYNMALYGLWIGLATALLFGAVITGYLVIRTDWDHEIDRVQRRLAGDRVERAGGGGDDDDVESGSGSGSVTERGSSTAGTKIGDDNDV